VAAPSEFVLDCYVSQDWTDTAAFIPFMERLLQKYNLHRIVVDSGYESEENYKYCKDHPKLNTICTESLWIPAMKVKKIINIARTILSCRYL